MALPSKSLVTRSCFDVRLFIAIHPDSATHAWLAESQRRLRKELSQFERQLRWVAPESIHVTLSFLGELPDAAPVVQALETCNCPSMELHVTGLGAFPNLRRPSVLWLGVEDPSTALQKLQREIVTAMTPFVEPERRQFEAHLTLARIKPGPHLSHLSAAIKTLAANWRSAPEPWRLTHFSLMQSELDSKGARHSVLREFGSAE